MAEDTGTVPCYVGIKACGCAVAAVVNEPAHTKDVARSVADFIRDGLRVELKTVQWARENLTTCKCPKDANAEA